MSGRKMWQIKKTETSKINFIKNEHPCANKKKQNKFVRNSPKKNIEKIQNTKTKCSKQKILK